MSTDARLAGIEYHGAGGTSDPCQQAVMNLFQLGRPLKRAYILTASNSHGLLLTDAVGDHVAIKSGFASGYGGTGPRAFSFVLALLYQSRIEIDEIVVDASLIERLDDSALSNRDVERIVGGHPKRPSTWTDYVFDDDFEAAKTGKLWTSFPLVVPFAIIDARIIDLARDFWSDPDERILRGYRRLEDLVRKRTGVRDHGAKLFSAAFLGDHPFLRWQVDDEAEQKGRANLFTAAFMAFRNPRAHRIRSDNAYEQLSEFLLLNQLFRLEANAVNCPQAS